MVRVPFETNQGAKRRFSMRRSGQVSKNIGSVTEVCDKENLVIFHREGGAIVPDPNRVLSRWILSRAKGATLFDRHKGTTR